MNLKELKKPFEKNFSKDLSKYNNNELVGMYLSTNSSIKQDKIVSNLMCESWGILQSLYYHNSKILTEEDCYEIFLQAFDYVIKKHVWDNPESTLYNDELAFMKAMSITVESRRKNFLKAKFRDKRIANTGAVSLDKLEEDFQDGYFTSYEEDFSEVKENAIEDRIKYYFRRKEYMASFILDAILNTNIFTDETNELDLRKVRKHIRNIDEVFCSYFSEKYEVNPDETNHCLIYIQEANQEKLDTKITRAFLILKEDPVILSLLNKKEN